MEKNSISSNNYGTEASMEVVNNRDVIEPTLAPLGESYKLVEELLESVKNMKEVKNTDSKSNENNVKNSKKQMEYTSPVSYTDYVIYYTDPVKQWTIRISNFILIPRYKIKTDQDEVLYYVEIRSQTTTKRAVMNAEVLTNNKAFKKFVRSKGDFVWRGNQFQLDYLNEYLVDYFECPNVVEVSYLGYQAESEDVENNIWIFINFAFYNGEVILPNAEGIFITPTKNYVLKKDILNNIEIKSPLIKRNLERDSILQIMRDLHKMYSENLWLGIGYMMATLQLSAITKITNQFPFYFPHGLRHSGKTEFLNLLFNFAGIEVELSSPPERIDVLRKHVSFYSHLPFGYDEAQDESKNSFFKRFEPVLKAYFNRQGQFRGDKDPNKIYNYPIRGSLVFAGELSVNNSALRTRTVFVEASEFMHDVKAFKNVRDNKEVLLGLGQFMMKTVHVWRNQFISNYNEYAELIDEYIDAKVLTRVKVNYAMLLAGAKVFLETIETHFQVCFNTSKLMEKLTNFCVKEMVKSFVAADESQNAVNYLTQVAYLANKDVLQENVHFKLEKDSSGNLKTLYLAHGEAWMALQDSRLETIYSSVNQASDDIKALSYFVKGSSNNPQKKIGNKNFRVWKFDLQHQDIPEFFQHFIGQERGNQR